MIYSFKSLFDRERIYTIDTEEPLSQYDDFSLSIKKVDRNDKSYSPDNIDCVLRYAKHGKLGIKTIQLESYNFNSYYSFVEKYKQRNAVSMGEPLELERKKEIYEFDGVTLETANEDIKKAFKKYVENNNIMETLFQCFLSGVSYGKREKI